MAKLYMVHCGYYDSDLLDGVFESHVNYFVVGESFDDARGKAKLHPDYQRKRMHIDGLQELEVVSGHRIQLVQDSSVNGQTIIHSSRHRDLAPKKA